MAKKLYIGNLNYSTDEASIRKMFEPHGEVVSLNLITDKYTGQSKGFGFVEMASDEAAKAAIAALNGQQIDGRAIRVNEAFDKPRGDGGESRRSRLPQVVGRATAGRPLRGLRPTVSFRYKPAEAGSGHADVACPLQ